MQCPLLGALCCCLISKALFVAAGLLGLALGILSAGWPRRSMGLYQWIMERFNWKALPIDEAREVRNTAVLGVFLTLFSGFFLALLFWPR